MFAIKLLWKEAKEALFSLLFKAVLIALDLIALDLIALGLTALGLTALGLIALDVSYWDFAPFFKAAALLKSRKSKLRERRQVASHHLLLTALAL
jgi:hypothetical protein